MGNKDAGVTVDTEITRHTTARVGGSGVTGDTRVSDGIGDTEITGVPGSL